MKKIYMSRLPLLAVLILSISFLASCDDDDEKNNGQVTLNSFGPSNVLHGEEITFIGENMNKVTSIVLPTDVEVVASSFKVHTADKIVFDVPLATGYGKVTLKTPQGDVISKSIYSPEAPIVINSFTDTAKPGENITIQGDFLDFVSEVWFSDGVLVQDFVSQSRDQIVVTVPAEAQTGPIALVRVDVGPEGLSVESETDLTVTLPSVVDFSPTSIRHMGEITLSGDDLDLVTKITFTGGASVTNFASQSETEIVVVVPAAAKDGKLTYAVASGIQMQTDDALSIILPNVTAFSPAAAGDHIPGATLTMTGTDLDLVQKITFPFVTAPVTTFANQSGTQIQLTIPAGAKGGTLVFTTIHGVTVPVSVPFGDQLTLATVIYDDAVKAPLVKGGWGGSITNFASTEQVRLGAAAIKIQYTGGWGGGGQIGNWDGLSISTSGRTSFAFSIYGGAGTEGKVINVLVGGKEVPVTIKEGEWKDVQIPLTSFQNPASISELAFQDQDWSGAVYIDHIGLK